MNNVKLIVTAMALACATPSFSESFEVEMLTKNGDEFMVFKPDFIAAKPGDSITFVPTDQSHNVQTIPGMFPEGAEPFQSKMNEKFTVTLTQEGVYGLKCLPHYAMGMVMLVQVGTPVNLEAAQEIRPRGNARARFVELFKLVSQ